MYSKLFYVTGLLSDFGIYTPPRPLPPCMCAARCGYPFTNLSEPLTTTTSDLYKLYRISKAFLVVF